MSQQSEWARLITEHLCQTWGWLPDEPEAIRLGENLARLLPDAVAGTNTSPDSLIRTLLHRPRESWVYSQALRDVDRELFDVTSVVGGEEVIYVADAREDLRALKLHNPYTPPPVIVLSESGA